MTPFLFESIQNRETKDELEFKKTKGKRMEKRREGKKRKRVSLLYGLITMKLADDTKQKRERVVYQLDVILV